MIFIPIVMFMKNGQLMLRIILILKIFNVQKHQFFFQSYFPSFLQSEMYYKYLSELVSTVTIATDLPKQSKHKRQGLNSLQEYLLQTYF